MTPERWQHLKKLLHSALELSPDERADFVVKACGDDEDLRNEIQSLLAQEHETTSFMEDPAFIVMAETFSEDQTNPLLQRTLGRYQIIAPLGSGGMGEIYLAEDTQLGRKVALKTLPAHFTLDEERVRRFQQEARAASALNHPNIITIYEIGQIDVRHFIVMEYIEGKTLRQHMGKTRLATAEALEVGAQVAFALATAHQAGIVHRDIKPENIMLRGDGIAKVLDFGLVKLTEQATVFFDEAALFKTAQGMVMGTACYMSPEQARGLVVDTRTDIWSLGVVLFEMVAGEAPFDGPTSSDVIAAILQREPPPLARYSPEAPMELEWIIKKALRKDRDERYQTARELLSDLNSLKQRLAFERELERSLDTGAPTALRDSRLGKRLVETLYLPNPEANRAYLKGRYHWNRRIEEGFKKAIDYFNQAIEKDKNYAQAYAGLADTYSLLSWYSVQTPSDSFPQAKQAALKALELDETLAEAHTALAFIKHSYDWDFVAADVEYRRALDLNPDYATARQWYALFLSAQGRHEEAIQQVEYAEELDPLSLVINRDGGWVSYWARQYDRAISYYQKTFELEPNFYIAHYFLGEVYQQKGDYQKAIEEFHQTRTHPAWTTKIWMLIAQARAHALKVERPEAEDKIEELISLSKQHYVSPYLISVLYVSLADRDQAFAWLEKALEERDPYLTYSKVEPALDPLRSDPRFEILQQRIGLPSVSIQKTLPPEKTQTIESRNDQEAESTKSSSPKGWRKLTTKVSLTLLAGLVIPGAAYLLWPFLQKPKQTTDLKNVSFTQLTNQPGPEFFPSLSPDGRMMAYASRASGNWDIYLQNVGETNALNLTRDFAVDDSQPAISPGGDRIAFRSEREGGGIFLMDIRGSSVLQLSNFGYSPAWSTDGMQVVVGTEKIPQPSTRPSKSQLWTINVRTNERRLITDGDALQPSFSPNGHRIAFWSRPSQVGQRDSIWTIPVTGGEAVPVTEGKTTDSNPVWSPDGGFLYFSSDRGGSVNIWRVSINEETGVVTGQPEAVTTIGATTSALYLSFSRDGKRLAYIAQEEVRNLQKASFDPANGKSSGERTSITRGSMQLWFPDVSPDGEWLTSYSMGNQRHIFIMRTDGSEVRDLTNDSHRHFWPRWSPDGKRIAFSSRRSGNYEIWSINADGTGLKQLTNGHQSPGAHYSPWSPDGKLIAYTIHTPKNECIIFEPDKAWSEQKLEYLPQLEDAGVSFEGWSWSRDGKRVAGIRHLPSGLHSGIGFYDLESKNFEWLTDFGDWPIWLNDNRHLLFVSQGKILSFDTRAKKYFTVLTVTDQDVDIGSVALSPDNRTVYFTYVAAEADIWLMTME